MIDSALNGDKLRAVLEGAPLNMSVISSDGDTVVATRGSRLMYRIFGAYLSPGRKNFPARITVGPVAGNPNKRHVDVDPDTGYGLKVYTAPRQQQVVDDLAQSVATAVSAAS